MLDMTLTTTDIAPPASNTRKWRRAVNMTLDYVQLWMAGRKTMTAHEPYYYGLEAQTAARNLYRVDYEYTLIQRDARGVCHVTEATYWVDRDNVKNESKMSVREAVTLLDRQRETYRTNAIMRKKPNFPNSQNTGNLPTKVWTGLGLGLF